MKRIFFLICFLFLVVNETQAGTVINSANCSITVARPTKNNGQQKIFYDGTHWWQFCKNGNNLYYQYSSDLTSWTAGGNSPVALAATQQTDNGVMDVFLYSGVVYVTTASTSNTPSYSQGTISGTSIGSWSANTNTVGTGSISKTDCPDYCIFAATDSNGKVYQMSDDGIGNTAFRKSSAVLSTSFSDSGATWNIVTSVGQCGSGLDRTKLFDIGSGNMMLLFNCDTRAVEYNTWNGSTWAGSAFLTGGIGSGSSRYDWDCTNFSTTNIWCVQEDTAATYTAWYWNGTTWTSKNAPSWPTSGLATNGFIALSNDGTNIYAAAIRGDGSKTLSYNKCTLSSSQCTWGGWTDIEATTSGTDVSMSSISGNGNIAILYSKTNGSNYDIIVNALSTGGGGGGGSSSSNINLLLGDDDP